MRKIPLLLIPLLLWVFMLSAQQNELSTKSRGDNLSHQRLQQIAALNRMNSQAAHRDKLEAQGQAVSDGKVSLKEPSKNVTNGKVLVTIKCIVTRELVKLIANAGGDIIDGSKEENTIIANVSAAAIKKISASPDVKEITPLQTPVSKPAASKGNAQDGVKDVIQIQNNITTPSVSKLTKKG